METSLTGGLVPLTPGPPERSAVRQRFAGTHGHHLRLCARCRGCPGPSWAPPRVSVPAVPPPRIGKRPDPVPELRKTLADKGLRVQGALRTSPARVASGLSSDAEPRDWPQAGTHGWPRLTGPFGCRPWPCWLTRPPMRLGQAFTFRPFCRGSAGACGGDRHPALRLVTPAHLDYPVLGADSCFAPSMCSRPGHPHTALPRGGRGAAPYGGEAGGSPRGLCPVHPLLGAGWGVCLVSG